MTKVISTVRLPWKINTHALIKELSSNEGLEILKTPLIIFMRLLHKVSDRALELDDPELNSLMCRLALYEQSDPNSKEYDEETTNATIHYKKNKNADLQNL